MTARERDTVQYSPIAAKARRGRTDLKRVRATTDAAIKAGAARDADVAPLLDDEWFAKAQAVQPVSKVAISIRVDRDVLKFFRRIGTGYQTRMNAVLRAFMDRAKAESRDAR